MKESTPAVQLNVYLVPHGYEANLHVDGREIWSQVRDFTTGRRGTIMRAALVNLLAKAIDDFHREPYGQPE